MYQAELECLLFKTPSLTSIRVEIHGAVSHSGGLSSIELWYVFIGHIVGSLWEGHRVHRGDNDKGRVDSGTEETLH